MSDRRPDALAVARVFRPGEFGSSPDLQASSLSPEEPSASKEAGYTNLFSGYPVRDRAAKIVHVDVDAFFASVEQVLDPRLRGKPVLVGRGVVASASYEAKTRGVRTAMSFREARKLCPQAIVVPGQYEHYADCAGRVGRLLENFTPAIEVAALDDFYLDFTGTDRLYPDFASTLRRMQQRVWEETDLGVSVGAATSKLVAAVAARLERPRGFRIVPPGTEEEFLAPLPVAKLHGIRHAHAVTLTERGIETIGPLRHASLARPSCTFSEAVR